MQASSTRPAGPSLERRLPLFVFALLFAVIAGDTAVTYGETRVNAEREAFEHLRHVSVQLAASARMSVTQRLTVIRGVAADSGIRAFLATPDSAHAPQALAALRQLARPSDSVTVAEIWSAGGSRRATTAPQLPPESVETKALISRLGRMRSDSAIIGPFYRLHDSTFFWAGSPVGTASRPPGYVLERRKLAGDTSAERRVRGLVGPDLRVYFVDEPGRYWNAVTGAPVAAPTAMATMSDAPDLMTYSRAPGERIVARREPVLGSRLAVVAEQPYASILDRPSAFLRRNALVALALLTASALLSWIIGRRITRPLVALDAGDEVGRLARTFNTMAESIARSRTDLERQVDESRELARRLDEANRAKSDFLAVMSHELRTPLNAIGGYLDLLDLGVQGPLTEAQRQSVSRMRHNQQQLLRVITSILDFTHVDSRRMAYEMTAVPVGTVLHETEERVEQQVRAKGLRYHCEHCSDDVVVWADRTRLQQVLFNLLLNAVRFTPAGGAVTVSVDASSEVVSIQVRDTGIGIPDEQLEAIFEPFVQAETGLTRRYEGAGLGLTLSREFAHGMGGDLTVESVKGRGTTFTLLLSRPRAARRELAS